jgi:hypothetical protein
MAVAKLFVWSGQLRKRRRYEGKERGGEMEESGKGMMGEGEFWEVMVLGLR